MYRPKIMRNRTTVSLLVVATILVVPIFATKWDAENYPNPKRDVNLCGREGKQSNICDPDSILTYAGANRIEGIIEDVWMGVAPYIKRECGESGPQGFQVRAASLRLNFYFISLPKQGVWQSPNTHLFFHVCLLRRSLSL